VHRSALPPGDVQLVRGVVATSPVRTVLDLARVLPTAEAVAAADSALRLRLCTYAELVAAVAALAPARGRPACRAVLERVDLASGSVLESLCRVVLEDGGLRPFETQHVVRSGRGTVGRVDFAWPEQRLLVEVDGFAFHADRSRYRSDRRRTNALVLAGWRVLRFSWEDVVHRPGVVVAQVRAALHA
jgi:very-short-patch-repair endonuclease